MLFYEFRNRTCLQARKMSQTRLRHGKIRQCMSEEKRCRFEAGKFLLLTARPLCVKAIAGSVLVRQGLISQSSLSASYPLTPCCMWMAWNRF